jgi:hypothetical protein
MEFVWRRLEEPPELFGLPLAFDPVWWLAISIPILIGALVLVALTYRRESRTIGRTWAALLGLLRTLTYVTLFFIWLLPAMRQVTTSEQQSKVAVLFDVSASLSETSDAAATDTPGEVRLTRQEELLELLKKAEPITAGGPTPPDFLAKLLEKNPLVCYRFGEVIDPQNWVVGRDGRPELDEWRRQLIPTGSGTWDQLPAFETIGSLVKLAQEVEGLSEQNASKSKALAEAVERNEAERRSIRGRLLNRTNIGQALRDVLQKEKGNLQGVILFSDGRPTAGSAQDVSEALTVAKRENVPVFTVGLGQLQTIANLRLVDVLAPTRVQPEDDFPVRVALEGDNLPAGQSANVILQVQRPGEKPEDLPAQQVNLTATSNRQARGSAEFRITNPKKIKGDWKFTARVTPLKGERTRADNVADEPKIVKVEERKLSVLLFASAASKEYQFVRGMLAREHEKFEVSICLQSAQSGTVQDIDPKRLLERFPPELRGRDADPNNLGNYDVIVAFDPDWRLLLGKEDAIGRASPMENLKKWVQELGGGLVLIAAPVHTFNLARDPELQSVRDLYPVVFDDSPDALHILDRANRDPWALNWDPAATTHPFLDLTDSGGPSHFFDGWDLFFDAQRNPETNQADMPSTRGFFSYFPIKRVQPGAQVLARYGDTNRKAQTPNNERQPFFVYSKSAKGPVFFIGSGETYRLRSFSEKFHERFWTKLLRSLGKRETSRGLLVVGSRYAEGETVVVETELLDNDLKPLAPDPRTPVLLKVNPPAGLADVPKEWKDGLPMQAEKGKPGSFAARFLVKSAGKYGVELRAPGAGELRASFVVETSDPERDDLRPDHALLHRLASTAQGVRLLDESKRAGFVEALQRAKEAMRRDAQEAPGGGAATLTPENDADRLFFHLKTATWIPECLDSNIVPFRSEGRVYDLWDKGVTVWQHLDAPDKAAGPSWALIVLCIFLGGEWLTRKLLRLA